MENKIFFLFWSDREPTEDFICTKFLNYVLKNGNERMFADEHADKDACRKLATSIWGDKNLRKIHEFRYLRNKSKIFNLNILQGNVITIF